MDMGIIIIMIMISAFRSASELVLQWRMHPAAAVRTPSNIAVYLVQQPSDGVLLTWTG